MPSRGFHPSRPGPRRTSRRLFLCLVLVGVSPHAGNGQEAHQDSSLFGPIYPRVNVSEGFQVDAAWPAGAKPAPWGAMSGIAVDAQDRVWTLNRGQVPVQVYDRSGTLLASWGEGIFSKPHQIRFDADGNVWITDAGLHVVRKFTPEGAILLTLGTPGEAGDDSEHLDGPTDIAIAPDGSLYVSDGYGNNRVVRFDAEGRFLSAWGRLGSGPGEFSLPHSIAIDRAGRLYVADRNNARIQVFDRTGRYLDEWRGVMVPWSLWITDRDEVFACGSSPMRWAGKLPLPGFVLGVPPKDQVVMRFRTDGRAEALWTFPMGQGTDCAPGELDWVHAVAVDSRGDVYLGDIQGCRAQRFQRLPSDVPPRGAELVESPPPRDDAVRQAVNP